MDVIDGRFEVLKRVASGGMAIVYRAHDRITDQDVALKVLRSEADLDRFVREAKTLARLSHPGIVQYVSHGYMPSNKPYLVQEWLDGVTLRDKLRDEGLIPDESVSAVRCVAEALAHAHDKGIVHRDIKPENLYVLGVSPVRIKVLDFGIARHDNNHITQTGTIIGTPAYMAPEQARGSREIDARADLFSLGCVLYECLAGRPAFTGFNAVAVRIKVMQCEPDALAPYCPEAPYELIELVERMMARAPQDRPSSAAEVVDLLGRIPPINSTTARPLGYYELPTNITGDIVAPNHMNCMVMAATVQEQSMEEIAALWKQWAHAEEYLHDVKIQVIAAKYLYLSCDNTHPAAVKATMMARCALALRKLLPQAVIIMETGEAEHKSTIVDNLMQAIDRQLRKDIFADYQGSSPRIDRIQIDKTTETLLGEDFEKEVVGDNIWLLVPNDPTRS